MMSPSFLFSKQNESEWCMFRAKITDHRGFKYLGVLIFFIHQNQLASA